MVVSEIKAMLPQADVYALGEHAKVLVVVTRERGAEGVGDADGHRNMLLALRAQLNIDVAVVFVPPEIRVQLYALPE